MTATLTPHAIRVKLIRGVTVTYWTDRNMVEISEKNKVVRSEIAPTNYTVGQFSKTCERVRAFYNQN